RVRLATRRAGGARLLLAQLHSADSPQSRSIAARVVGVRAQDLAQTPPISYRGRRQGTPLTNRPGTGRIPLCGLAVTRQHVTMCSENKPRPRLSGPALCLGSSVSAGCGPGTCATCSCGRSARPQILKALACQDAWMDSAHGDCEVSFPMVVPVGVWRLQLESCMSSLAGDVPEVTLRQLRIAKVCDVLDLSPWGDA